jgi:hypothetical protein
MYKKFLSLLFLLMSILAWPVKGQMTFQSYIFSQNQIPSNAQIFQTSDSGFSAIAEYHNAGSDWLLFFRFPLESFLSSSKKISSANVISKVGSVLCRNGEYMISGLTNSNPGGILIIKLNALGDLKWDSTYKCGDNNYASTIIQTQDGGFVVGGTERNIATGSMFTTLEVLMKIDSVGKVVWAKRMWDSTSKKFNSASITSVIELHDRGLLTIGNEDGDLGERISIGRFDKDGTLMWHKVAKVKGAILVKAVAKTLDEGFTITGSENDYKAQVSHFDSLGNLKWSRNIDAFASLQGVSLVEGSKRETLVAGNFDSGGGGDSVALIRLDSNGSPESLMISRFPDGSTITYSLIKKYDGGYLLTGGSSSPLDRGMLFTGLDTSFSGCEFATSPYAADSNVVVEPETYFSFLIDSVIVGSAALTEAVSDGQQFFFCTSDNGAVLSKLLPNSDLSLFPNPITANEPLTISLTSSFRIGSYSISLLSLLGNTLKNEKINLTGAKQDILFKMPECPAGVYFIELQSENGVVAKAKFVKE